MTAIGPYSQSYNFTHMFNQGDLRGPLPKQNFACPNSLMDIIQKTPRFSRFMYMIKLTELQNVLGQNQANFTLFIPSDSYLKEIDDNYFINMDRGTALHIVKSSMLDNKITSDLIEESPAAWFYTKDMPNRLFISNISGKTYINNNINVVEKDILATNGVIHVVDKLIMPLIVC